MLADGGAVGRRLAAELRERGDEVIQAVPRSAFASTDGAFTLRSGSGSDLAKLWSTVGSGRLAGVDGILCLWPLDAAWSTPVAASADPPGLTDPTSDAALAVLHLVQSLAAMAHARPPQLVLITRGAQSGLPGGDRLSILQAPVLGLARTIRQEHPELRTVAFDLDPSVTGDASVIATALLGVLDEPEVAFRGDRRLVRRLVRMSSPWDERAPGDGEESGGDADGESRQLPAPDGPFRLEPTSPGTLDGLELRPAARRTPGHGEVAIEVVAAGLNFRDVMKTLGIYPQQPGDLMWLGDEVAGRVVAVGEGVDLEIGAEVFGVAPAAFASVATTRARYVLRKTPGMTFEEAATLPIAFATALYGLVNLANLRPGERVLVHAGAGGVGQAAIQVAQAIGAEVLATASEGKADYVRSLGVRHVFDSRSLDFVDGVRAATDGAGVDVVLNSLAGDFIPASMSVLAPGGRFVEIGKRDIFQNAKISLWPFRNGLSFFAVDMDRIFLRQEQVAADLMAALERGLAAGHFRPLPLTTFPIGSAVRAFRHLAAARQIGKVVLSMADRPAPRAITGPIFHADASYVVTGGLRGLGGRVAEWMAASGAGTLVLVGRDTSSPAAQATAQRIAAAGGQAVLIGADVANAADVAKLVAAMRPMPPLRGIVHAAGVLSDSSAVNFDDARFTSVFGPKALGAWNLHEATSGIDLDFFVMFSSMAAVVGNPGQGNYTAANAFLDRLAWLRKAQGLPGLSVDWGPWAEIGMSATASGQRIFEFGIGSITPDRGIEALGRLLPDDRAQIMVLPVDWPRFLTLLPGARSDPFLSEIRAAVDLGADAAKGGGEALTTLLAAAPEERHELLVEFIRGELARVLELRPEDLPVQQPLNTVGLDSLMALELKNKVEAGLSIDLPIMSLIKGPTIAELATELLGRIGEPWTGAGVESAYAAGLRDAAEATPSLEDIEQLLTRSRPGAA